ncbi:MAG: UDP-galactopyranose mutase [Desulfovibrionaceae bacterium]|nr:UDP-galactopyranose mutase [Desulfovibrionaceae bacterium]
MEPKLFIVGAGLFGSVLAERIANKLKLPVTILEKRNHLGGNCHSELEEETGIECHKYGSHIFHTSIPRVWEYLKPFCEFTGYRHTVLIKHQGHIYSMPINLFTINDLYQKNLTPKEASLFLKSEIARDHLKNPQNLEEKAISLIGRPLYEAFIKNYTTKQWGRDPKKLPQEIITRLPFRTSYNTSYFKDTWQGVPKEGYFTLFKKLLDHPLITVKLNCSYESEKASLPKDSLIIYTGLPDALFDYQFGPLEWRSLDFEWEIVQVQDFQGNSVVNYADLSEKFTRIHEFKHYHPERETPFNLNKTIICREYPANYVQGSEAYYPINDAKNTELYAKYVNLASQNKNLILGGRLGQYQYFDMDKTIAGALSSFDELEKRFKA